MTKDPDMIVGTSVLTGHHNWQHASWADRMRAILFGRWRLFRHMRCRCALTIWRGEPYLVWIGDA